MLKTVWPHLVTITSGLTGCYWNSHCFPNFLLLWYILICNIDHPCLFFFFFLSVIQKPLLKQSQLGLNAVMTHCWLTSTLEKLSASQSWHHCAPTNKVPTSVFKCYDSRGIDKQQHMTDNGTSPLIRPCGIKQKGEGLLWVRDLVCSLGDKQYSAVATMLVLRGKNIWSSYINNVDQGW